MNSQANPEASQTYLKDIACTVAANSVVLAVDFTVNGGPYGIALAAEANIKKPTLNDLMKFPTWRNGYAKTWSVLKYGFYPTFLLEVALSEAGKTVHSDMFAKYSEIFMPAIVGMGTAPAVSLAALNERFQLNYDPVRVIRQQGFNGLVKLSAGSIPIGLREGLCYYALHHDTSEWAKHVSKSTLPSPISFLFRRENGEPTLLTRGLVSVPDAACVFAGQPLTVLAVNASITKYLFSQQSYTSTNIGSMSGYLETRLFFWKSVCKNIVEQGKKSGLSSVKSFLPGTWLRTASLLGTVGVFKTCLDPTKEWIRENITHSQPRIRQ